MIKKLKRTLIIVGMFVLMMGIGTNIQVKADTLGQVKSIKTKTNYNNYLFSIFISCIGNIIIFLIMYLPIYYKIGEKLILTIILLFISIVITEFISYKILCTKKNYTWLNIVSLLMIITLYIIFGYLTYNPIICPLFFDPLNEKYGINNYLIT